MGVGWTIRVFGTRLVTGNEYAFRFDAAAGGSAPSRLQVAFPSRRRYVGLNAGIDYEIPQHFIQRRAHVLPREPCRMRKAARRAEQHMRLRRSCEAVKVEFRME